MEPAPEIKYKRLTRSGARSGFAVAFQSRASLWLGPDHLLSVESSGYTEKYKRFYFRDIQSFVVQKTNVFRTLNFIFGVILLFLLVLLGWAIKANGASNSQDGAFYGIFFGAFFGAVFLILLLLNLIRGESCKTFLRTAVQIEQLPSLNRVRKTRNVLKKIHPLIAVAQGGELTPEAVSAQLRESTEPAPTGASSATAEDDPNVPPRLGT